MQINGYEVMVDAIAKFHCFLYISGWFHHPNDALQSVILHDAAELMSTRQVGVPHKGVEKALGPDKGFILQVFRSSNEVGAAAQIEFITQCGERICVSLLDLCKDRAARNDTARLSREFIQEVTAQNCAAMLDIGGRARSGIDRKKFFPGVAVTVLDILPGDNVDVVGDAHELSKYFPVESFDAVFSVSVFEHLIMPWKVVSEINKVLKLGGIGFVHTHQTLGMHDMPWDFWRFSSDAWGALFNRYTGFEIVGRGMSDLQYIVPFLYQERKAHAEKSAGFESSSVWFRKTGPCVVSWDVPVSGIVDTIYPEAPPVSYT